MNEMMLLGALVVGSVGMIVYSLLPRGKEEDDKKLRRRMAGKLASDEHTAEARPKGSAARQMLERVAPYAMRPVMPKSEEDMTTLRHKLAQGGFRHESASRFFLASKTITAGVVAVGSLAFAWTGGYEPMRLFGIVAFAAGIGFMLPNVWLYLARSQRMEKIRNGLPDSLDLLVVSVESGLALDAGLQRVSDEMRNVHPELSEEMQIATLETQMGVRRSEALEHMGDRCGVEEMRTLVAVITQAEKFGTSIARALRIQADTLRQKRRLKAEERAQKTTVKLMLPLVLFIFPSIFVVLVGPAALRIIKTLGAGSPLMG